MTSFADDNRRILNTNKRQYNINVNATAAQPTASSAKYVSRKQYGVSGEQTLGAAVLSAAAKRKKAADAKNARFADENRVKIRKSFAEGTKKVDYSYDEYTVKEHNFPIGLVAIAFAVTVVAVFLLLNYSQITKYNNSINALEEQIAEYNAQIAELDILLDKKTDLSVIEKYASENGMITSEQVVSHYVSMSDSYKIEKSGDREEEFSISTVMSGVAKLFSDVLGD